MSIDDHQPSSDGPFTPLDEKTVKLLKKALALSPEDWETRSHLLSHYIHAEAWDLAKTCLAQAPAPPRSEEDQLLKAKVEAHFDQSMAIRTLTEILQRNK